MGSVHWCQIHDSYKDFFETRRADQYDTHGGNSVSFLGDASSVGEPDVKFYVSSIADRHFVMQYQGKS